MSRQYSFQALKLIDLTVMSDEIIQEHGFAALMELLLKHHKDKQLVRFLDKLQQSGALTRLFSGFGDGRYPIVVLDYLLNTGDDPTSKAEQVIDIFSKALPKHGDDIMTFAQRLKQEAMQQGIERGVNQGLQEGKYLVAKNMLLKGYAEEEVASLTGIDRQIVLNLQKEI